MQNNDWKEYAKNRKLQLNTEREPLPLMKYPKDLDFSKTVGGTTYVVKSHCTTNIYAHLDFTSKRASAEAMKWIDDTLLSQTLGNDDPEKPIPTP